MNHIRLKSTSPGDSDEDDEEPRNERGTSYNYPDLLDPVLPYISADEDGEYRDEFCARSRDS